MRFRIACPVLLLLTGSGSLLYGLLFHTVTVYREEETEVSIAYPSPFAPAATSPLPTPEREESPFEQPDTGDGTSRELPARPGHGGAEDDVNPFETPLAKGTGEEMGNDCSDNPFETPSGSDESPPLPPDLTVETVVKKTLVSLEEGESAIVREVTVGGIARLADGQLRRTYTGKPPSLCPS